MYAQYIEILKKKQQKGFAKGVLIHKHHIMPKHDGGAEDGPLVLCTIRDHARAHYIRYLVFGQTYDLCAYYGLVNKNDEREKAMYKQIVETNRQRGKTFFNNDFQKEMAVRPKRSYYLRDNPDFALEIAKKGGSIGGKAKSPLKDAVLKINGKNVGTKYGRINGLKGQNETTRKMLSKFIEWEHITGVFCVTPPVESVVELMDHLNFFVPYSVSLTSGLSAILRGVEPRRYGWKRVKTLDLDSQECET